MRAALDVVAQALGVARQPVGVELELDPSMPEQRAAGGRHGTRREVWRKCARRAAPERVQPWTWHEASIPRIVIPIVLAVHATIAALTWRDIANRPDRRIGGGPKALWRVASALNTMGSGAYWTIGRKR